MSAQCPCGTPITGAGRTGMCRSCAASRANVNPVVIAKRRKTRWGDWPSSDQVLYHSLREGKKCSAAEAKRLVLEHQACRQSCDQGPRPFGQIAAGIVASMQVTV